jgi:hypothetical protein
MFAYYTIVWNDEFYFDVAGNDPELADRAIVNRHPTWALRILH